jgi:vitamin B12 transporter
MNESQETCSADHFTILPRGGKELSMNIRHSVFSATILLFSVFTSAQDTVTAVPDSGQWFADSNSLVYQDAQAERSASLSETRPADTVAPADSGRAYTIVVTAARREQPSEWVSDDHTEINVAAISRNTAKTVAELLATTVPARMSDMGGGAVKNISLMGAGSERTLVLIDGRRVGVTDGDLGDLQPEVIEKIEIVEGGQSALWGMDAVGGVVNIITRRPSAGQKFGNLSMAVSSFEPPDGLPRINTMEHNFSTGINKGHLGWSAGANWQTSDGRFHYRDSDTSFRFRENNGFTNWGVFQRLGYDGKGFALGASASYCDRAIGTPGKITYPGQATTNKKIGFVNAEGSWTASDFLTIKMNASYARDSIHYYDPNPFWAQDSRHVWSRREVECIQEFTLGRQMATTGIQMVNQSVISNELGSHGALQSALFANGILEQSTDDIVIRETPAVRIDYSTIYKGALNGKLGLMATLKDTPEPSVFVNFGSSYRSPPFTDLFWPQDAYAVGNPDLKPERSLDFNTGVQLRHGNRETMVTVRSSFFSMALSDMLLWQPRRADSTDTVWTIKNIDRAYVLGAKINLSVRRSESLTGSVNFAYNDARNSATKAILIYRPKFMLTASGHGSWRSFSADLSCRFSSRVFTDELNTRHLPSIWTFDASAGYTLMPLGAGSDGVRLVYDLLNISDKKRYTNEGYPLPGREHRLSLKVGF